MQQGRAHVSQSFRPIGRSNAAMQLVTAALLAVFLLTSLAVGVRLVVLHLRTRRAPELLIGLGILGVGPMGMGGLLGAAGLHAAGSAAAPYVAGIAVLAIVVGFVAAGLFNWQVYRPESTAARLAIGVGVLLAGIGYGIEIGTTAFADPLHPGAGILVITLCNASTLIWGATESLLYWRLMRRAARDSVSRTRSSRTASCSTASGSARRESARSSRWRPRSCSGRGWPRCRS